MLPGVIGSMQAMEVVKLLADIGKPLVGKLLHYDALNVSFRNFQLKPDSECLLCSEKSSFKGIGYSQSNPEKHTSNFPSTEMKEITVTELKKRMDSDSIDFLLDVRALHEFEAANIGGELIPLPILPNSLDLIPKDKEIIIYCKAGIRSARACNILLESGYTNVVNVVGGMDAWLSKFS